MGEPSGLSIGEETEQPLQHETYCTEWLSCPGCSLAVWTIS